MNNPLFIVNVEAAIFKKDQWLMGKRSEDEDHAVGSLAFIGGKVENFDNVDDVLKETLTRETLEEAGVEIHILQYVKSSLFITNGIDVIDIVFLCVYTGGKPGAKQPKEISSVFWMTFDEIMKSNKVEIWTKNSLKIAEQMRLQRHCSSL